MENDFIEQLFSNLDRWRHLPSYQLERRTDILFSLYLPAYLEHRFKLKVQAIIPEFPVHIGTIYPKIKIDKSFKIDYLVKFSGNHVAFIELKTEMASRNEKQDKYLQEAKRVGLPALSSGILKIISKTQAKKKYEHLRKMLIEAGFLNKENVVNKTECDISICYLQPWSSDAKESMITFSEFANFVSSFPDSLSQRFSKSLSLWGSTQAGDHHQVAG